MRKGTDLVSGTRKGHRKGVIAKLMRRQVEICQGKGRCARQEEYHVTEAWG